MKAATKRLITAMIVAPLAIGVVGGGVGLFADGWKAAAYFFVGTTSFAAVFGLAYAVPLHLILRQLGRAGISGYLVGAVLAGVVIAFLNTRYMGLQVSFDALPFGLISVGTLILACLFTAGLAWAIARPDRSEAVKERQ